MSIIDAFRLRDTLSSPGAATSVVPGNEYNAPTEGFPAGDSAYIGEQDTNRLARGDRVDATHISARDSIRITNIPIALSVGVWEQPQSSYSALYPYNHVRATTNGLIEEFDDSPGAVRYSRQHPSGTFIEEDPSGSVTRRIVGESFEIIENNSNVYIKGRCNVTVEGSINLLVKTHCNLEVEGQLNAQIRGDAQIAVSGSTVLNTKEDVKITGDKITMECNRFDLIAREQMNVQGKELNETFSEKVVVKSNSYSLENAESTAIKTAKMGIESSAETSIKASEINAQASGEVKIKSGGQMNVDGGGSTAIKGSDITLNGPTTTAGAAYFNSTITGATAAQETIGANIYLRANAGTGPVTSPSAPVDPVATTTPSTPQTTGLIPPRARQSPAEPQLPTPVRISRSDALAHSNDEGTANNLWNGYSSPAPTPTSEPEAPPPGTAIVTNIDNEQEILNITIPSDALVLSRHYNLGKLSTFCVASRCTVTAQRNLTVGQIILNLKYVATNVLDKIADTYGPSNVLVTSGFRYDRVGNQSFHGIGQAVDLQFRDIRPDEYYQRAREIAALIPYDGFLLEYKNEGTRLPWLHIQFRKEGNRGFRRTYFNHRQVAQEFVNLQPDIERQLTASAIIQRLAGRSPEELAAFRLSSENII